MNIFEYTSVGSMGQKPVTLAFSKSEKSGIYFKLKDNSIISADISALKSSKRNTVLGSDLVDLCFVEHLLATIHLMKIDSLEIEVQGQEIPLEEGSGQVWHQLLQENAEKLLYLPEGQPVISISEPLSVADNRGHKVIAVPSDKFKMTYLFVDPVTGMRSWIEWNEDEDIELLINARTFAPKMENELFGLAGKVLSYDEDGFDQELRMPNEPAYHKALDLFGDLSLSGVNPLLIKGHFISYQGSHYLNTEMAKLIYQL